jgi:hypothetical protein
MSFYWLILGVLATWRVTHLLNAEDGPWQLMVRLRQFAGDGFFGELLDCFYCLSLWIAAPLAIVIGETAKERLFLWLALSGGSALLERMSRHCESENPVAITYLDDPEELQTHRVLGH